MSKKGLPVTIKMRHDSHYVEDLAKTNRSVGRRIPIHLIEPNPEQPRVEIGDLTELSGSIKEKGVLEPILVKPVAGAGKWMIIAGERRWRAANLAGLTEMPCIELDIDEKDVAEIALIENLQRKDLTVWEEVDGYAYLIEKFDYTHDEIAKKIGKSRSTITESLTVAGLPDDIRAKCRQLDINSKSSLLEIARQFDEQAMHDFLDNFGARVDKRAAQRRNVRAEKSSSTGAQRAADKKVLDFNRSDANNNSKIFTFVAADKSFNLEINFPNLESSPDKNKILAALKEAYNETKNAN